MARLHALIAACVLLTAASAIRAGAAPAAARATLIQGNAWTAENAPIPAARLRLRNVASGKIQGATTANEAGQFTFANVEPGTYLVELVNQSASVLAVSHVFTVAADETVATFVRLGTRPPGLLGLFTNAAAAVTSGAASLGIGALAPISRPASAGR
jgi:hypothetical protein